MRHDGRAHDQLRPITFQRAFTDQTPGSVLVSFGRTKVLCTVSIDDDVPRWMRGKGEGWVTAEYSMLPGSSHDRVGRESKKGKQKGRTLEIERLIGRALRAVCDMEKLGEREITVDCDVLQADGGTRTAAITGGFVALADAIDTLVTAGRLGASAIIHTVAAVSVGVHHGRALLDLSYEEDATADVDMNVVMNDTGDFIEVQGTGEGATFSRDQLNTMLTLAGTGIDTLIDIQRQAREQHP